MKPLFVEFLGPSGVGKSTLYKSVQNQWNLDKQWVTFDHIYSKKKRFPFSQVRSVIKTLRNLKGSEYEIPHPGSIFKLWYQLNDNSEYYLKKSHAILNNDLIDMIHVHTHSNFNGDDKRFETIYMMIWAMTQYLTILEKKADSRIVLMNEGELFLNRLMHLITPSFDEKSLKRYVELIPLPVGVIYLNDDIDVIVERVKNRKRVSSVHTGMNNEILHQYTNKAVDMAQLMIKILMEKNIDVLKLNASDSIDLNTEKSVNFIEKFVQK